MRVLVTGGAGFIGRQVVRLLLDRGDEVIAPLRDAGGRTRIGATGTGLQTPLAAIDDRPAMDAVIAETTPDAAIHLAWYANPSDYRTSSENLRSLQTTIDLTRALLAHGCQKLVHAGSCFEYRVADGPRREADATEPRSLYAATKLAAGHVMTQLAMDANANMAWGRIFFPYGPGENPNRLLPLVARRLSAGEPVDLTNGQQVRDQVHVEDVASGLVRLTASDASGIYNLGSGERVTMRATVEALAELIGRADLLRFGVYPERHDEPEVMFSEMSRLTGLGWQPRYPDVREGLRASLDAYLAEEGQG